jgi:hypothetical protein
MPEYDWVGNILHVDEETDKNSVDAFFASIASKVDEQSGFGLLIDFQKIIPVATNEEDHDWRKTSPTARWNAWGTSAYSCHRQRKFDDNTIGFFTAWTGVPELMQELSRQNPEVKLRYIGEFLMEKQEDESGRYCSIVTFVFQGGELLLARDWYEQDTEEPYEKYLEDLYNDEPRTEERIYFDTLRSKREEALRQECEERERRFEELSRDCPNPLEVTVEELNLKPRPFNCLKRASINSVADIVALTHEELSKVRNFNGKCVLEVIDKLSRLGLSLKE